MPDKVEEPEWVSEQLMAPGGGVMEESPLVDDSSKDLDDMARKEDNPTMDGFEGFNGGSPTSPICCLALSDMPIHRSKEPSDRKLHTAATEFQAAGGFVMLPPPPKPPDANPQGGDSLSSPAESTSASTAVTSTIPVIDPYDPSPLKFTTPTSATTHPPWWPTGTAGRWVHLNLQYGQSSPSKKPLESPPPSKVNTSLESSSLSRDDKIVAHVFFQLVASNVVFPVPCNDEFFGGATTDLINMPNLVLYPTSTTCSLKCPTTPVWIWLGTLRYSL